MLMLMYTEDGSLKKYQQISNGCILKWTNKNDTIVYQIKILQINPLHGKCVSLAFSMTCYIYIMILRKTFKNVYKNELRHHLNYKLAENI